MSITTTTEVEIQYYQSVTNKCDGLSKTKNSLKGEIQVISKYSEKSEKHLKDFQNYMLSLEENIKQLYISIEERKQMEQHKSEQLDHEMEVLNGKLTDLQDQQKSSQNLYKKMIYKLNNSLTTLDKKRIQMEENLIFLYQNKDQLTQQLNSELQVVSDSKQQYRSLSIELQSKISSVQQGIREQEEQDVQEQEMENQLKFQIGQMAQQGEEIVSQMNDQLKRNIANLQVAISHLDQNIKVVQGNITNLNQFIASQKNQNQQLQIQLTQITEKINVQINILIEQKQVLTVQVEEFESSTANQLKELTITYNTLTTDQTQFVQEIAKYKVTIINLKDQETEYQSEIRKLTELQQDQVNKFNTQFYEIQTRLTRQNEIYTTQRNKLHQTHQKLEQKFTQYQINIENYQKEQTSIKFTYEQTITDINIKISETTLILKNYEVDIQKYQATASEFRPAYYVSLRNKGKYVKKVSETQEGEVRDEDEEEEELSEDEDEEISESDEEHYNVVVKFLTKGRIKTGKNKFKIELEKGAFFITYTGSIKKAERNKNIWTDSRKNASANFNFSYRVKLFEELDRTTNERISIKGNKIHKLEVSQKKGTCIRLKIRKQDIGAPHQAVAANVNYFGSYEDNNRTLVMALRGMTIDLNGAISGDGSDPRGRFTVSGLLNTTTNEVKFTQTFVDKQIYEYRGVWENKTIKGRWYQGLYSGPFQITTTKKILVCKGWSEMDGEKKDMEFILMLKSSKDTNDISANQADVVGEGTDSKGRAFRWTGTIVKQGRVNLLKTYLGAHSVKYTGVQVDKKISGQWELNGITGNFELEEAFDEDYARKKEYLATHTATGLAHRACGSNQNYFGSYDDDQGKYVQLAFTDFNIDLDGVIHGAGCDDGGKFSVFGQLNLTSNDVDFKKQYDKFAIYFKGVYDNNTINGSWSYYQNAHYGFFSISYTSKIISYSGSYRQDGRKYYQYFTLMYKLKNEVTGTGRDEIGQFQWSGTFENGGKANLVKQYVGKHSIKFSGQVIKGKFSGTLELEEKSFPFEMDETPVDSEHQKGHKAIGVKQNYFGSYEYNDQVTVVCLKDLTVSENGEITGSGNDSKGNYTVYGILDVLGNDNIKITKYYNDSYIEFKGLYSGSSIKGKWSVYPNTYYSSFTLTNTSKIFSYNGWQDTAGKKDKLEFVLMLRTNNQVEGVGSDSIGKFIWTGTIENQGKANLVKQYIRLHSVKDKGKVQGKNMFAANLIEQYVGIHTVKYNGKVQGKNIAGNWEIQGGKSGIFDITEL